MNMSKPFHPLDRASSLHVHVVHLTIIACKFCLGFNSHVKVEKRNGIDWYIFKKYEKTLEEGSYDENSVLGKRRMTAGEADVFRETLRGLGWKYELSAKEKKIALENDDAVAASTLGQMKNAQVTMENMAKQGWKVVMNLENQIGNKECQHAAMDLKKAIRELKKSIGEYEEALDFKSTSDGKPLTNAAAFTILGNGGEALTACLSKAEIGKALNKIASNK